MDENLKPNPNLPIRHSLAMVYILSLIIAVLMSAASVMGLQYRSVIYPTDDLLQSFIPTDIVNLIIGLPILLGSMWSARRGKLIGLLLWPGALFFILYNYLVCVFAMPLNTTFLLHLILFTTCAYTLIALITSIDGEAVQQRLAGSVPERVSGGILAVLGLFFLLRVITTLVNTLIAHTAIFETELAQHISDFLIAPASIIGGVLLWQRRKFGYVAELGLLFQVSMLFIGLIILMIIQPILTNAAFDVTDIIVVFVMGLICFIPLALYMRGVNSSRLPAAE